MDRRPWKVSLTGSRAWLSPRSAWLFGPLNTDWSLWGDAMRAYECRHVVGFEETNVVGNVYYVNHLRWQGRCREMFLREHAPEVLAALADGLYIATTRCSCEYLAELSAFDEVVIRMRLGELVQNRLTMTFEYVRLNRDKEELVARGEQQVAFMRRDGDRMLPTPVPETLREVLRAYAVPAAAPETLPTPPPQPGRMSAQRPPGRD